MEHERRRADLVQAAGADRGRPSTTVFVVEGEKDADNLAALGLVSTTNVGGAGKWRESYNDALRAECGDPARQ